MRDFLIVLKIILVCATTFFCVPATAQSPSELAQKNLQRQKWQRAYSLLQKSLAKDSLNVTAKYVLAQYFFSEENPAHDLDSAYTFVTEAFSGFQSSSTKQKERLRRFPLDSVRLVSLRQQIDSVAFIRAKILHTEKGYIDYIARFMSSSSLGEAAALRDSVAFADALDENTYQSFEHFLQKYPQAAQSQSASFYYEKLLLAAKTSDQTLASYESFLRDHPNTRYRTLLEQTIFEFRTASGDPQRFVDFAYDYPGNVFVKRAKDILFHLIPPSKRPVEWPADFSSDSLTNIIRLEQEYLVPFLKNGKFGFMDSNGNEALAPDVDSISYEFTCGNIDDDIILLPNQITTKSGFTIWKGNIAEIEDIGSGFLLIANADCKWVLHKSGFHIGDTCISNAKILNRKLLAIQSRDRRWSLWSFSGKLLLRDADDVFNIKDVICVKSSGMIKLLPHSTFGTSPIALEVGDIFHYDEVKPWAYDLLWVKRNEQEGLVRQSLEPFVPLSLQSLTPSAAGVVAKDASGSKLYAYNGGISETYSTIISRFDWVLVKDTLWKFLDRTTLKKISLHYDTISFSGPFAIASRSDSIHVFFTTSKVWRGKRTALEFVPGKDSTSFLIITQGPHKTLYNHLGERLFSLQADNIQHAGNDLFIIQKKEKKGLITSNGKMLLSIEYDAISKVNNGVISLLKSSQFGLFDCIRKRQIPCSYTKNLQPYNPHYIVAHKNGLVGFIGWDNKPVGKIEFDEIQFWNDTTALVKKNSDWMLYVIKTKTVLMNNIKDLNRIHDTRDDQLAIVYKDGNHGVMHNWNGTIIPITFTDIINVGSIEKPLYFAGQKLTVDPTFAVTYFNDRGEAIRQEMYNQEDYDRIFCNQ